MVRVLFASVAKNISQYFKNIKESFELFCDHEPASQMLVIESQSEDDSKSLLLDWMVKDNRVNVYHDTFTFDEIKREMCIRTIKNQNFKQEEIARCRNILLQHMINNMKRLNMLLCLIGIFSHYCPFKNYIIA